MVYKNMADPFVSNGLRYNIRDLKNVVKSTMELVHNKSVLGHKPLDDERFQERVISALEKTINNDFIHDLNNNVNIWSRTKSGIIKDYFKERFDNLQPERYLKTAVLCNSKGGNDVLTEDLEPWLDALAATMSKDSVHKKEMEKVATRKIMLANLRSMIAFPITVKETPVATHLSEEVIMGLILNESQKYLPNINNQSISETLQVASNVVKYKKMIEGEERTYRAEGRCKMTEAPKWAKFIVGVRKEPHFDGGAFMEIVSSYYEIEKYVSDILLMKNKKTECRVDQRIPAEHSKRVVAAAEDSIIQLLKTTYLTKGEVDETKVKLYRNNLIYGTWIDMNLKSTKAPIEVQVKDPLGYLLYGVNSPFGHNSKAYSKLRSDEVEKKVTVKGHEYAVDEIIHYIARDIMVPAFQTSQF